MKRIKLSKIILALSIALIMLPTVSFAVNPVWVTSENLDNKTTHIFLPNQNVYYQLATNTYYFEEAGMWKESIEAPASLQNQNLAQEPQVALQVKKNEKAYADNVKHRQDYIKLSQAQHKALLKEQKDDLKDVEKSLKQLKKEEKERQKAVKAEKKKLQAEQKALKQQEKAQKAIIKAEKQQAKLQKQLERAEKNKLKAEKKAAKVNS